MNWVRVELCHRMLTLQPIIGGNAGSGQSPSKTTRRAPTGFSESSELRAKDALIEVLREDNRRLREKLALLGVASSPLALAGTPAVIEDDASIASARETSKTLTSVNKENSMSINERYFVSPGALPPTAALAQASDAVMIVPAPPKEPDAKTEPNVPLHARIDSTPDASANPLSCKPSCKSRHRRAVVLDDDEEDQGEGEAAARHPSATPVISERRDDDPVSSAVETGTMTPWSARKLVLSDESSEGEDPGDQSNYGLCKTPPPVSSDIVAMGHGVEQSTVWHCAACTQRHERLVTQADQCDRCGVPREAEAVEAVEEVDTLRMSSGRHAMVYVDNDGNSASDGNSDSDNGSDLADFIVPDSDETEGEEDVSTPSPPPPPPPPRTAPGKHRATPAPITIELIDSSEASSDEGDTRLRARLKPAKPLRQPASASAVTRTTVRTPRAATPSNASTRRELTARAQVFNRAPCMSTLYVHPACPPCMSTLHVSVPLRYLAPASLA